MSQIPAEVQERLSSLRLPSFWAAKDGTRWVSVSVGSSAPGLDAEAPVGTWMAQVEDLGFWVERPSIDETVNAMVELLRAHVADKGAETPRANYQRDPDGPGCLLLVPGIWAENKLKVAKRSGRSHLGLLTPIRVTPRPEGGFLVEPLPKEATA